MSDLLVRLKLDDKKLDGQLKGVSSKFAAAAKGIAAITLPVAAIAGIAKAVDGLASMGEEAINAAGSLNDLSLQLGVSAERLQELRVLSKDAGIEAAELDTAIAFLNKSIGQAALGQGELVKYLKAGGVELVNSQGYVKDAATIWDELTERVRSGAYTQEQATALAAAAFGRSGTKLVAVMKQTEEQQRALIETAREYGAIISNDVARAADEYGTKLDLIKAGTEALDIQNKLILAPLTLKWAELKNEIAGATAELLRAVGLIDDNTTLQMRRMKQIERQMDVLREAASFTGENEATTAQLAVLQKQWDDLAASIEKARQEAEYEKLIATPFIQTRSPGMTPTETDQQRKEREREAKQAADYELGLVTAVFEERERIAQLELDQTAEWATELAAERERVYVLEFEQLQDWNQTLFEERERAGEMELEQYFKKEGLLTKARKEGMEARLAFDQMEAGEKVATTIGALEQITAGVAQHSRKAFNLNKLAAISNAIINTAEGATKALAQGGFAGIAMAAAVIASGTAQIAAIKRTTFQGGGGGTTPSNVGRTTTVNGNPVGGSDRTITVRGINANDVFTGRALVDLLNEATKDGARLVLAH